MLQVWIILNISMKYFLQSKLEIGWDLFRQNSNKYDKHAILVKYHGQKIGYVPRRDNYNLSKLMDGGKELIGVVESFGVDEVFELPQLIEVEDSYFTGCML